MSTAWWSTGATRFSAALISLGVLLGAGLPTLLGVWSGRKNLDDFAVVYAGARALWNHLDIYAATAGMYIYSPFLAFIFQPLAVLPERAADVVWLLLIGSIIFFAALIAANKVARIWLCQRAIDPSPRLVIATAAMALSFEKIRADFVLGQTDCLMIIGFVAVLCLMTRRALMAGIATGAVGNIKYLALIFVPYFLGKRNYRAALASIVSFFLFFTLPAVEVGLRSMKIYSINAFAVLTRVAAVRNWIDLTAVGRSHKPIVNSVTWPNSVSLTSSILRMTRSHGISDVFGGIAIALFFAGVVTVIVLIGRHHGVNLLIGSTATSNASADRVASIEWAVLIVLALVFGPQTTPRHMILVLLVYTVAVAILIVQTRRAPRILLIVSMATTALALSLPFRDTGSHPWLVTLKSAGVASWCSLSLVLLIAWFGSRTISDTGGTS